MRVFLLGVALCALTTSAFAQSFDSYDPQASVYLSYSFDTPPPKLHEPASSALKYGFQLDRDWRNHFSVNDDRAPLLRWEFSDYRFDNLSISGQPLFDRQMILRQDEEGGGLFGYLKNNLGPIVIGTGVAILAVAIIDGDVDSRNRDPDDPDGIGTNNSGTVNCSSPTDADNAPGSNESDCQNPGGGSGATGGLGGIADGATGDTGDGGMTDGGTPVDDIVDTIGL